MRQSAILFAHQKVTDLLVLNEDRRDHTRFCFGKPRGRVRFFSRQAAVQNGVFTADGVIYEAENGCNTPDYEDFGGFFCRVVHNIENYMAAFAAVRDLAGREAMRSVSYGIPRRCP